MLDGCSTKLLWSSSQCGEVSREEKMALRGTDPESYITDYTLVYEDKLLWSGTRASVLPLLRGLLDHSSWLKRRARI